MVMVTIGTKFRSKNSIAPRLLCLRIRANARQRPVASATARTPATNCIIGGARGGPDSTLTCIEPCIIDEVCTADDPACTSRGHEGNYQESQGDQHDPHSSEPARRFIVQLVVVGVRAAQLVCPEAALVGHPRRDGVADRRPPSALGPELAEQRRAVPAAVIVTDENMRGQARVGPSVRWSRPPPSCRRPLDRTRALVTLDPSPAGRGTHTVTTTFPAARPPRLGAEVPLFNREAQSQQLRRVLHFRRPRPLAEGWTVNAA